MEILLSCLTDHIVGTIFSDSQCVFRPHRKAMDMIFTARQIQGKLYEQEEGLFYFFVNLIKILDTAKENLRKISSYNYVVLVIS